MNAKKKNVKSSGDIIIAIIISSNKAIYPANRGLASPWLNVPDRPTVCIFPLFQNFCFVLFCASSKCFSLPSTYSMLLSTAFEETTSEMYWDHACFLGSGHQRSQLWQENIENTLTEIFIDHYIQHPLGTKKSKHHYVSSICPLL